MKIEFKNKFLEDKEMLRQAVRVLKMQEVIHFDSDVARDLGYSRGAVSEILSIKSTKKVTYSFVQKFKIKYDEFLLVDDKELDKIKFLQNEIEVLKQCYLELCKKVGYKKSQALLEAEYNKAVKLKNSL